MELQVIIKIDSKNKARYEDLFLKAYKALTECDPPVISEEKQNTLAAGRFTSLDEFFHYMANLYELDHTYLMLPLDEDPFVINLNTRTISVPSSFSKIAGVQNDQIAETIQFSVDRYFDAMDLANTEIWVQWTAPGKDGKLHEGATCIEVRDYMTEADKIRFAWPLDSDITAVPGNVQFSVRFWKKGTVPEYNPTTGEYEDVTKIVYSLNTLTATIPIKPALQPELNDATTINNPLADGFFKKAIVNSVNPAIQYPQSPTFEPPGQNLPQFTSLNEDDTLTLVAQALVGDTGFITYKWYYTDVDNTLTINCTDEFVYTYDDPDDDKVKYSITLDGFGSVANNVLLETHPTERDSRETYWYYVDNNEAAAIAKWEGEIPVTTLDSKNEVIKLYEKFTTYTVPSNYSGDAKKIIYDDEGIVLTEETVQVSNIIIPVTGTYVVKAYNTVGKYTTEDPSEDTNAITNTTNLPTTSQPCRLVSPSDVIISEKNNLPKNITIQKADEGAILKVILDLPADDLSKLKYNWRYTNVKDGILSDIETPENEEDITKFNTYTAMNPGWYDAFITSSLNRETRSNTTQLCRVVNLPAVPQVVFGPISSNKAEDNQYNAEVAEDATAVLDVAVTGINQTNGLECDEMLYTWYVHDVNGKKRPLTDSDIGVYITEDSNPLSPSITVYGVAGNQQSNGRTFFCQVVNKLNDFTSDPAELSFFIY